MKNKLLRLSLSQFWIDIGAKHVDHVTEAVIAEEIIQLASELIRDMVFPDDVSWIIDEMVLISTIKDRNFLSIVLTKAINDISDTLYSLKAQHETLEFYSHRNGSVLVKII